MSTGTHNTGQDTEMMAKESANAPFLSDPDDTERSDISNVLALQAFGQAVWLDYMRHSLMTGGELQRLIEEDGLRGITSNPSIFEKAVTESDDYDDLLGSPDLRSLDAKARYEELAVRDVQEAADALRHVYETTGKRDGYVSLEVSPLLAYDVPGTIDEARRLWRAIGRDNTMIKVPGTPQGIAALRKLVGEGININATLLFSQGSYQQIAEAYVAGVEEWVANGGDPQHVASVASFFVSRIDTVIDARIAERLKELKSVNDQSILRALAGKVAIANAKLAYQRYLTIFGGPRWAALAKRGAQTQRLLWASTGTKNPAYRDVLYVEELIAADTVNTMPPATLDAFRDHGRLRESLTENIAAARETMKALSSVGISMDEVTDRLVADGVRQFVDAFNKLLVAVVEKGSS